MSSSVADSRARRGAKRERVLKEAARALNRRGVCETSLSEIARRLGFTRAALYYYFRDQEDLVFQSYRYSCEVMAARLSEARSTAGDTMAVIETFIDSMLDAKAVETAALGEVAFLQPERQAAVRELYEGIKANLIELLEAGTRRGELRNCTASVVAPAIIGLISWVPRMHRWRVRDQLSHRDLIDAIKSLLRLGVAADRRAVASYAPYDLAGPAMPVGRAFNAQALAAFKHEALLASASWLFNRKGADATSLDEIASRVGVTKKTIYHNIGDKQALIVACFRRSFKFYEELSRRNRAYPGSRLEAFCASTHAGIEGSVREDIAPLAIANLLDALPKNVKEEVLASTQRLVAEYLSLFKEGELEGSMRSLHTRALIAIHFGIFQWLPMWFEVLSPNERSITARELTELARIGLSPV